MVEAVEIYTGGATGIAEDGGIPTMLSPDERALYRELGRGYSGSGRVIEFGPWLGSGTFQLCTGLEESGREWRLTVFDRFVWSALYARRWPRVGLDAEASFQPLFEENLAPFRDRVAIIKSEINDLAGAMPLSATSGIELLYVDAPKSWRMLRQMLTVLGPFLLPGARILFQDFLHITSRQLMWLLASVPSLRMTSLVGTGTSAVFLAEGPITTLDAVAPPQIASLDAGALRAIWERLRPSLPPSRRGEAVAGLALDLLARRDVEGAAEVLDADLRGQSWEGDALKQIDRLVRIGGESEAALSEIAAYVRGKPFGHSA